jgi:hypothetical protein
VKKFKKIRHGSQEIHDEKNEVVHYCLLLVLALKQEPWGCYGGGEGAPGGIFSAAQPKQTGLMGVVI